ncbi:MAG: NADH-quinone oxidoreductase subunit A [Gemmataceae bacterium]
MTKTVGYLLLFLLTGAGFVLVNLMLGKLFRPKDATPEKGTIYECGEPTIGSAWVQFDLRFYVVALLFVVFDVEMAFFFPWAVVFGQAVNAADAGSVDAHRLAWIAFFDVLFFFGVLLVGYAYLWRRGDLDWVRSLAAQRKDSGPMTTDESGTMKDESKPVLV